MITFRYQGIPNKSRNGVVFNVSVLKSAKSSIYRFASKSKKLL